MRSLGLVVLSALVMGGCLGRTGMDLPTAFASDTSRAGDAAANGDPGLVRYQLVFTTQPSIAVASGAPLPIGPVVQVQDSRGQLVTTGTLAAASVILADGSGNGNLAGTTRVSAVGGIAAFPNDDLRFEKGGSTHLRAEATVSGYGTLEGVSGPVSVSVPTPTTVFLFSGAKDPNGDVDGNGTSARLFLPMALTTDGTYVYVSEASCVIRRYDLSTTAVTTWTGQLNVCRDQDGPRGANGIIETNGLANDGTYVYFTGLNVVRRAAIATGSIETIAGNTGASGYLDSTLGTNARLSLRGDPIWLNGTSLYVADNGNCRIRRVDLSSANFPVTTIAGNGGCGAVDDANALNAGIGGITAFAADGTYLYFADVSTHSFRGYVWTSTAMTTLAGNGGNGIDGLALVGTEAYVVTGNRLFVAPLSTWVPSEVAGTSWVPGEVDGGLGTSMLSRGSLLAVGTRVLLADKDNGALRSFDTTSGMLTTLAGAVDSGQGTTDGTATTARYYMLRDAASDGTNLYACDYEEHVIRAISLADGSSATHAAGWGLHCAAAQVLAMIGQTLYLSDAAAYVRAIDTTAWTLTNVVGTGTPGEVEGAFDTAQLMAPELLVTDQSALYLFDNHALKKLDLAARTVSVLSGIPGLDGCATGSATASRYPVSMASGAYLDGHVYVATGCVGWGILAIDTKTGDSTLYAGDTIDGYQDGPLATARFEWGAGITSDGVDLYVYDINNLVVRKVSSQTGASTLFGSRARPYTIDGPLSTTASDGPADISYNAAPYYGYGKLYLLHQRDVRVVE